MSSTNRGAERQETDAYFTPPQLAQLIVEEIGPFISTKGEDFSALEPGCGNGSFLDALAAYGVQDRLGVELVPAYAAECRAKGHEVLEADYLTWQPPEGRPSLIIGNPPFRLMEAFIDHSLEIVADGGVVAFLCRLNFLGGTNRFQRLWSQRPPSHVFVLPARPGFTADGGADSIEYTVVVWHKLEEEVQDGTRLHWIDNTKIQNKWTPGNAPTYVKTTPPSTLGAWA
jgi:hypothetical protein